MPIVVGLVLAVGAFLIIAVSRAFRRELQKPSTTTEGFVLGDLRELHQTGQLTDEEYERARLSVLSAADRLGSDRDLSSSPSVSALAGLGRTEPRGFDVIVKPDEPQNNPLLRHTRRRHISRPLATLSRRG